MMKTIMKRNSEHGAVMVEASIYFPLVFCTVVAMLYLGLINMQESAMMYQVDRIARDVARTEAYPGYDVFNMNQGRNLDFDWGGTTPSKDTVNSYFVSHHADISKLYREVFGIFKGSSSSEAGYESKYRNAAQSVTMIGIGTIGTPDVEIEKNLFNSKVTVTITHHIPIPGVLRYLGLEDDFNLECKSTKSIVNPGEFVRNVDLAVDLTEYLLEKLDPGGNIKGFLTKTENILKKIL